MHEIDPDENVRGEGLPDEGVPGDEMGPRDGTGTETGTDRSMDPDALSAPGRVPPDDLSAIPRDRQPHQASDQSGAPIPDVMGDRGDATPDVMGAPVPETDETLGDRREGDEPR